MDVRIKLEVLADAAKYDASCASSGAKRSNGGQGLGNATGTGICHSYTPDGRCVSLLKILLTNHCIYDCQYCVNRVSNDVRRARFTVDEVVNLTLDFYRRNYIEGLFLSSGVIRDPDYTMALLGEVARKLREEHYFCGYIHLKAVVGASQEAVARAGMHADRLSANLELPRQADLDRLAPGKSIHDTEQTMAGIKRGIDAAQADQPARRTAGTQPAASGGISCPSTPRVARPGRIEGLRRGPRSSAPRFAPAGQSTQLVVGASAATDGDILFAADGLYRRHKLRRVYYSAYSPIPNAPSVMPAHKPPLVREHRLYQADWLIRFYGFGVGEILKPDANLDLEVDPKLAWALRHRELFPLDVNRDARELLLRVPGLGVRNVDRLIALRRQQAVRHRDLRKLRVPARALPFLVAADGAAETRHLDKDHLRTRILQRDRQLTLFGASRSALSGEL